MTDNNLEYCVAPLREQFDLMRQGWTYTSKALTVSINHVAMERKIGVTSAKLLPRPCEM